ncbi:trypsin-like peptidase domain-containing protein [Candidatus Parcubacteria bacterium]|nr:trypsin-like peptidase domain-containing protein [Candidatus Parcubacteria bacterium]
MHDQDYIIRAVKKVTPAVVSIAIAKRLEPHPVLSPFGPFVDLGELFAIPRDEQDRVKVGGGSGFVVAPEGIVVTNRHVVADPEASYTVVLSDGAQLPATILARDPINDVAILKISAPRPLPIVPLGDSGALELGQTVVTVGNALGLFQNTVSTGVVSGLSRFINAAAEFGGPASELRGLIQTDAAINPGNSGGPLVNMGGEAIGINTAIVFGAQNIGFAIPINHARRDLADLKRHGRIRQPSLGIRYVIVTKALQKIQNLPVDYGAWVVGEGTPWDHAVIPNGPADLAGLKEHDIILECNGQKINETNTLIDHVQKFNVGDRIPLKIRRGEEEQEVEVRLGERR